MSIQYGAAKELIRGLIMDWVLDPDHQPPDPGDIMLLASNITWVLFTEGEIVADEVRNHRPV